MGFLKKFFTAPVPTVLEIAPSPSPKSMGNVETKPADLFYKFKKFQTTSMSEPDKRILDIEAQALALGWTWKQLWQVCKRPDVRGLASSIQKEQVITQVARQYIQLERISPTGKLEVQRFYNHAVDQPWLQTSSP